MANTATIKASANIAIAWGTGNAATALDAVYAEMGYAPDCLAPLTLEQVGTLAVQNELRRNNGNLTETARSLGISRSYAVTLRGRFVSAIRSIAPLAALFVICAHLCPSVANAASGGLPQSPALRLVAAPAVVITNKAVVIHFDAWPTNWFLTNSVTQKQWIGSTTANGMTTDSNYTVTVTTRMQMPSPTNYIVTATIGRNRSGLQTNFVAAIMANRGPVTLWLSPTNKYTIGLWAMFRDGWTNSAGFADWPAAPSNQVRFIVTPIFSQNLRDWTAGTNNYTFTITNAVGFGTNQFVRWSAAAVKDDFTPKAVVFDQNTIQITK